MTRSNDSAALIQKADRALASARLLLDAGDTDGACNRAYYAMFDAARAALVNEVEPLKTRTHSGLIAAFGLQLVKPGRLSKELGGCEPRRGRQATCRLHWRLGRA